jgi:hypothetical protein
MDLGSAPGEVWAFDVEHWGVMAIGAGESDAIELLLGDALPAFSAFVTRHGGTPSSDTEPNVVERLASAPDEYAFSFDRMSATEVERERTIEILDWAHHDLLELIRSASDLELDHADPERRLPTWAWWTTPRLIAWHIAITECRY